MDIEKNILEDQLQLPDIDSKFADRIDSNVFSRSTWQWTPSRRTFLKCTGATAALLTLMWGDNPFSLVDTANAEMPKLELAKIGVANICTIIGPKNGTESFNMFDLEGKPLGQDRGRDLAYLVRKEDEVMGIVSPHSPFATLIEPCTDDIAIVDLKFAKTAPSLYKRIQFTQMYYGISKLGQAFLYSTPERNGMPLAEISSKMEVKFNGFVITPENEIYYTTEISSQHGTHPAFIYSRFINMEVDFDDRYLREVSYYFLNPTNATVYYTNTGESIDHPFESDYESKDHFHDFSAIVSKDLLGESGDNLLKVYLVPQTTKSLPQYAQECVGKLPYNLPYTIIDQNTILFSPIAPLYSAREGDSFLGLNENGERVRYTIAATWQNLSSKRSEIVPRIGQKVQELIQTNGKGTLLLGTEPWGTWNKRGWLLKQEVLDPEVL